MTLYSKDWKTQLSHLLFIIDIGAWSRAYIILTRVELVQACLNQKSMLSITHIASYIADKYLATRNAQELQDI